jgi:hypothetical protein
MKKTRLNRLEYFKKIFGLVWFRFHKLETENPNRKNKKIKQKKTKPN